MVGEEEGGCAVRGGGVVGKEESGVVFVAVEEKRASLEGCC